MVTSSISIETMESRGTVVARPDILIRNSQDALIAAIEIKNLREWPDSMPVAMRRNMIVHGVLPAVPYFLLLSQDKGFAWLQVADTPEDELDRDPDVVFPMQNVIQRYATAGLADHWLRGWELEYVVLRWLDDLAVGNRNDDDEAEKALERLGFLKVVRDASVLPEAVL